MLNRLFELENIKYVISVDDCFADTNEKELRDELFVSAMVSFDVIKALLRDFEKNDKVAEIEELQELGLDHSQLVQELIDSLTIDQVKECTKLYPSAKENLEGERAGITAFLEKLKSDGMIEKYVTISNTHEAEVYDTESAGMTNGAILWLIDKSFMNVGESATAGIEFAKNKVKTCKSVKQYIFMLTTINSTSEREEDVAKDFDQLLLESGAEHPSFIYYISKNKVLGKNYDKIAKSLAFGFKRKECYMLMDIYTNCLRDSCDPTIVALRKIDQKTLDYIFSNKVEANGESHFDFIARLVSIFHDREYSVLLTSKQEEICQHIQSYQEICRRAPQEPGNLNPINEIMANVRRKELYDVSVNARYSEIATGDIFKIKDQYYILVTQSCDTVLRKDGKRKLDKAILLKIMDNPQVKYKYDLSCFCDEKTDMKRPAVIFQNYEVLPFELLDLCAFTVDGMSCIDLETFESDTTFYCAMTPNYRLRYEMVKPVISKIYSQKLLVDNHFSGSDGSTSLESIKQAYDYMSECDTYLRSFDVKDNLLTYPIQRIARLNELSTVELLKEYGNVLSRIGQPFDFTKSDCATD